MKHFHSKAVRDSTQNFPTGPVSTFLLTWPDPSPPQTRIFGAVGSTRPQHCSKANCATADKVNGVRPVGDINARKNFAPPLFFGAKRNIFKSSRSAYKTFVSDQGRASFLCESKQKKTEKKTCSYPVTPQCITRRFRLAPRSAKRPGPFGFTNIWRT